MTNFLSRLFGRKTSSTSVRKQPRRERSRRLQMEQMEKRQLLANDLFGAVDGTVFTDLADNGSFEDGTDPGLAGATVRLYNDVGVVGTFEPNVDTQVGVDIQTDANGNYVFTGLAAGNYIVEQLPVTGQLQREGANIQAVTVVDDTGIRSAPLDGFITAPSTNPLPAAPGNTATSQQASAGTEIVGGERDVVVQNSAGSGSNLNFNINGAGLLVIDAGVGTSGQVEITYDGVDGSASDNAHGLNLDLTANNGGAFVFELGRANTSNLGLDASFLTVEVYSGNDTTASSLRLPIPSVPGGTADVELHFCFDDFQRLTGATADADFTNVSAVKLVTEVGLADDISVDFVGIEQLNAVTANLPNLNPMSLGNQVFNDANNNGTFDTGESGIDGVQVQLFFDSNTNGAYDDGIDTAVPGATGVTSGGGLYLFEDLLPGEYIVFIPEGQAVLDGFQTSTGNPDPDNDTDDDDNGALIDGIGFATSAVSLASGDEPDGDDNLTVDFGFAPALDLSITKDGPATVVAGNTLTYVIMVDNSSGADATNAFMIDDLPAIPGLTNGDITVERTLGTGSVTIDVTQTNSEIRVDYPTLADDQSDQITITIDLPADTPSGTLTNVASTGADQDETNEQNNQAEVITTVSRDASLSITKSDTPDPVERGGTLTYEIIVTNTGPSTSTNTVLTDTLLAGLSFVPGSSSASNGATVSAAGQAVTSNLGTLDVNSPVTVTITTTVANDFPDATIPNTASVDSTEADPATATANTAVDPEIDLILSKIDDVADGATTTRGSQLVYTLVVTNDGPSDATNVRILDTLPDQVDFGSVSGGTASGPDANRLLTINVGNIPASESRTVTINTTIENDFPEDSFINSAEVTSNETEAGDEPVQSNNQASETTIVDPLINLRVDKVADQTTVVPGDQLVYTIDVFNDGPSDATNVILSDLIPSEVTVVSGSTTVGTFGRNGNEVSVDIGTLAANSSARITVTTTVNSDTAADFTNVATVSGTEDESNDDDNSAAATTTVDVVSLASLAGSVYFDANSNGTFDDTESGIEGVSVRLTGEGVDETLLTDASGNYVFTDLAPGTYTLVQTQPTGFDDGQTTVGTGATAVAGTNEFTTLVIGTGANAVDFDFGETRAALSKRRLLASTNDLA